MKEEKNIYVGNRYVPKIMGEWNKQEPYEGLSIVTNEGTSYTSKKGVPIGVDILNENYWVVTGNYNAQIENYRQEVKRNSQELTNYKGEVTSQLQQNKQLNTVNIKEHGVLDGTDITDLLNNLLQKDTEVDLMNGHYIISDEVVLLDRSVLKNGTFTIKKNGMFITMEGSFIHHVDFVGENMLNQAVVKIIRHHVRLYKVTFNKVTTAIRVDATGKGFYNIKITDFDINLCDTGIHVISENFYITALVIDRGYIFFRKEGIVLDRGDLTKITNRGQLSHSNITNITFIEWNLGNESVGLFVNAGWNNFSNLNFFYDGDKRFKFTAIKMGETTPNIYSWDIVQGFRSNNFSNMMIEGDIDLNGIEHLGTFKNIKFPPSGLKFSETAGYVSYSTETGYSQHLDDNTDLSMANTLDGDYVAGLVTIGKVSGLGKGYTIKNLKDTQKNVVIKFKMSNGLKEKLLLEKTKHLMLSMLYEDGSISTVSNAKYQYKVSEHSSNTQILPYTYQNGILTNKGHIQYAVWQINQETKNAIKTKSELAVEVLLTMPAKSTIVVKDFQLFPYVTTLLNETNKSWQNDYMG